MTVRELLAVATRISHRWLRMHTSSRRPDAELGRMMLKGTMFDEHLLRDIGFREEVSRFHRNHFPRF